MSCTQENARLRHSMLAGAMAMLLTAVCGNDPARSMDITLEVCPLDTLTFVDPWSGGEFRVEKAGRNYRYLCPDGMKATPGNRQDCSGPFGALVLQGQLTRYRDEQSKTAFAVWNTIKGAPCCWWNVFTGRGDVEALKDANFKWYGPGDVPRLRDMPFLAIETDAQSNERAGEIFGNSKTALRCVLR